MLWIILSLPLLVWLWLGVSFTIIDFALHWARKELNMHGTLNVKHETPARLIRYVDKLDVPSMPGLLSFYDVEKNLLRIDRVLAANLPNMDRERLEMTDHVFTRLASTGETGLRFKPMVTLQGNVELTQ